LGDFSRLDYQRVGDILAVRPLVQILGPWDGLDDPPAEAGELRDQLRQLMVAEAEPLLLLDLRAFGFRAIGTGSCFRCTEIAPCKARKWMACVRAEVAELFASTTLDRLLPMSTDFDEAIVMLS
jgi:hypothetical protein